MWAGGAYGTAEEYAVSQPPAATMVAVAAELRSANVSTLSQSTGVNPSVPLATSVDDYLAASVGSPVSHSAMIGNIAHDSEADQSDSTIAILSADELTENEAILRSGAMTPGSGFHGNTGAYVVESLSSALAAIAESQSAMPSRAPSQAASRVGTPMMSAAETSDPDTDARSVYNVPSFGVGPSRTAELFREGLIAARLADSESEFDSTAHRQVDSSSDTSRKTGGELSAAQDFAVMRMPSTFGHSTDLNSDAENEEKLVRVHFVSLAEIAAADPTPGESLDDSAPTTLTTTTDEERDDILGSKPGFETNLPLVELRDADDRKPRTEGSQDYQHPLVQGQAQLVILSELPSLAMDGSGDSSKHGPGQVTEDDYVAVATMPLATAQNAIAELRRRGTSNVRYLGFCMLVLWTAFNTVQGLIISWNPALGTIVMATYYVSFVCSSFLVGAIMQRYTALWTLRVTWVFFVMFIASLIMPVAVIVIIATVIVGFAGAPMWTAQAMYVGKNSDSTTIARNNGAFAGIQQNNFIISSLSSALLLSFTSLKPTDLFAGAAALALIAVVLSKFLKTPSFLAPGTELSIDTYNQEVVMLQVASPLIEEYLGEHTIEHVDQPEAKALLPSMGPSDDPMPETLSVAPARGIDVSKKESFLTVVRRESWVLFTLHQHKRVVMMIPFWFFTGLFYGLPFGPLPTLLPINFVGFGLATFGVGSVSSSLFFSHLAGRALITSRTGIFIASALQTVCLGLSFYAASINKSSEVLSYVIVFIAYFFGGFADGGLNPNLLALVPASCPDNRAAGFALFRVYQSLAMVFGNVCLMFGWRTTELAIVGAIWLALSLLCMIANGPLVIPD